MVLKFGHVAPQLSLPLTPNPPLLHWTWHLTRYNALRGRPTDNKNCRIKFSIIIDNICKNSYEIEQLYKYISEEPMVCLWNHGMNDAFVSTERKFLDQSFCTDQCPVSLYFKVVCSASLRPPQNEGPKLHKKYW